MGRDRFDEKRKRLKFDWKALEAYLGTHAAPWLASMLTIRATHDAVLRYSLFARMALDRPAAPDLARLEEVLFDAVDPGRGVAWNELTEYSCRVHVVEDLVSELTRRGLHSLAAMLGRAVLARIEAKLDLVADDGYVEMAIDDLRGAIAAAEGA